MPIKQLSSLLLIASLLACAAGCARTRPAVQELEQLYQTNDAHDTTPDTAPPDVAQPPDKTIRFDFAEGGQKQIDMTAIRFKLDDAIQQALLHNISMLNAADQVQSARFRVESAESEFDLKILPRATAGISGGDSGTRSDQGFGLRFQQKLPFGTGLGVDAETAKFGDDYSSKAGFDVNQPLLRGLGTEVSRAALLDAEFTLLASERAFLQYQENLIVSVVRSFYDIIRYRELLALTEQSAERTRQYMRAAQAREKVGLASRIDVLRAEIQLSQAEDNLLTAREFYGNALDAFRIQIGFGPQENVDIEADLSYNIFTINENHAIESAMQNRLDLATTRDEIAETERNVRIAKNQTLPQLDVVFSYSRIGTGDGFSNSTDLNESQWSVGLVSRTDLWRKAEHVRYQQSLLELDARKRNVRLQEDTVTREVKDALRMLEKNRQRIANQETEIQLARQKQRLAQIKFDRGLADNFDLIDAEEEIRRAEAGRIVAITDYIVSQVQLKRTIGTLIERPRELIAR